MLRGGSRIIKTEAELSLRLTLASLAAVLLLITSLAANAQNNADDSHVVIQQDQGSNRLQQDVHLRSESGFYQTVRTGLGNSATGDDCAQIDTAIENAYRATTIPPKVIHLSGGNWRCKDARHLVILPGDKGDYLNTFSGHGAQFSLKIINGKILSCDVSGGVGYNPSSYIIGQVIDYTRRGSGGALFAMADARGVSRPGSCVVASAGMGYLSPRDVNTVSFAQGADGAVATLTLQHGVVTGANMVSNGSTMPNGNGYTSIPTTGLPTGFKCSVAPSITLTHGTSGLSTTAITGIKSTSGHNCTYKNSDSGTVPVFIGGSDPTGTEQAVNVAPEPIDVLPCAIQLRPGIVIDGDGALLEADWATSAYTLTASKAIFCDAYGDQADGAGIRNMTLSSIADVWLAGRVSNFTLENVSGIYSAPRGGNSGGTKIGRGGGLLFYAAQTGPNTMFRHVSVQSPGAVVIGGQWTSRAGTSGLGSMGGYDVARGASERGGSFDNLSIEGLSQSNSAGPQVPPYSSYSAELDAFFERYVWKSQNSPRTNSKAPNGTGSCFVTLKTSIRQVDTNYGSSSSGQFYNCYRGVSDMLFVGIPRLSRMSLAVSLRDLAKVGAYRPAVIASIDRSRIEELSFTQGIPYKDPYIPDHAKALGVVEIPDPDPSFTAPSIILENFNLTQFTGFYYQYSITQWSSSRTENVCVWGISGVKNSC